jgi:hypothetical protein
LKEQRKLREPVGQNGVAMSMAIDVRLQEVGSTLVLLRCRGVAPGHHQLWDSYTNPLKSCIKI